MSNDRALVLVRLIREAVFRIRLARIFARIPGGSWR
jgi:hypothetical protein